MATSTDNFDYQDFDPFHEWSEDQESATLILMLPGFTKEQLTVQVTSTSVLMINGERQILEKNRRRFSKEFPIPPYCDTNNVSAKFKGGVLTIKFPKLITPAAKPQPQPQQDKEPETVDNKQESPQEEKQSTNDEKVENLTEKSSPQKQNEPISEEKQKGEKTEEVAPQNNKVRTNGGPDTAEATTPKARMTQRLKTRVLDLTMSFRSAEDKDIVKEGFGGSKCAKLIKRPKIWMNIIVAILLVMVLGLYVKNAFRSSQGGSDFKEF